MKKIEKKQSEKDGDPYQEMVEILQGKPDIVLGTVAAKVPSSPTANITYVWTRKIRAKTVSKALSKSQYDAFQKAIETHRKIDSRLKQIRETSARNIIESIPGVRKKGTHKRPWENP